MYNMEIQPTMLQINRAINGISLGMPQVLDLVEIMNNYPGKCLEVIRILEDIFLHEKSCKILLASEMLEYFIKNCSRCFHKAADKQSFQKSVINLLRRQRGKMSLFKELSANLQNWSKIQARILYLIQLWYDAFILQQRSYPHIINNYKILRMQGVMFPPRSKNERSLLYIQTDSPILDNIESISKFERQKFSKIVSTLKNNKYQVQQPIKTKQNHDKLVDIDQISEKIAIVKSQDYKVQDVIHMIDQIKKAIQIDKVLSSQQKYWKNIKQAAQILIQQWQDKNSDLIKQKQKKYLQNKLNLINEPIVQKHEENNDKHDNNNNKDNIINLLDQGEPVIINQENKVNQIEINQKTQEINLLQL